MKYCYKTSLSVYPKVVTYNDLGTIAPTPEMSNFNLQL